jgi:hypothetical protein
MQRFEAEPRAVAMPPGFPVWYEEMLMIAELGAWALVGAWMRSPVEECRFLVSLPGVWQGLIACAEWADRRRYESGVLNGRGVGV